MRKRYTGRLGFTLIELLVVVLIIGILAAVAVPQYKKAILKSQLVQIQVYIDALRKGSEMYFLANGNYTTDIEKLDVDVASGAKEIKKSNIASGGIKGVFFEHDIECVVTSYAIACLSPDFYLTRKHDYDPTQNQSVAQWPEGIECVGRNKERGDQLAEQICKAMSDGIAVEDYNNFESKAYIIGN